MTPEEFQQPPARRSKDAGSKPSEGWLTELSPTIQLALPIMSGMVAQMLMGLADTLMVGRLGGVPLAAASFVNAVAHPPLVFCMGLVSAIAVLASQAYGAKENRVAGEVFRLGLVVVLVTGIAAGFILMALVPWLGYFGQPPEVIAESRTYLVLFGWSILPAMAAQAAKNYCEALNHPWMANAIMLGGVGLNVFLNWLLIYGNWGFPAMGLEGAGWATVFARIGIVLGLLGYICWSPAIRPYHPARWAERIDWASLKRMLRLGGPVAFQHLLEVSAFAFAALMMGWLSAEALAAHQIAITCAATTFMLALGIGMAACIRVGHAWGAGDHFRMRRIGFLGMGLGAGVMAGFGVIFILAGEPLASLFVHSSSIVQLTSQLFFIAALFQVVDGLQVTAINALRGLSDVRMPAIIAILAYWVVAVPFGFVLGFKTSLGAVGIWIGLASGLAVAAGCLAWRFHLRTKQYLSHLTG